MRSSTVVTRDGTSLHVEEWGDPEAAVTLVLSHGWTLDRRTWAGQVAALPEAAGVPVRILTYDHRGHGRSGAAAPGTATIARLGEDLAEILIERVPTGRLVLAGHSMGGMTIMALAEHAPELFAGRVAACAFVSTSSGGLAGASPGMPEPVGRLLRRIERIAAPRMIAKGNRGLGPRGTAVFRRSLRRLLFGTEAGPAALTLTTEQFALHWPATYMAFRDTLDEHERADALAACRGIPVTVLCGSRDQLCPPAHSRRIVEAVPGADLVVCDGAGHMLPLERPDEVTDRLAALVRGAHLEGTARSGTATAM